MRIMLGDHSWTNTILRKHVRCSMEVEILQINEDGRIYGAKYFLLPRTVGSALSFCRTAISWGTSGTVDAAGMAPSTGSLRDGFSALLGAMPSKYSDTCR